MTARAMHANSIASFHASDFGPREALIINLLHQHWLMPLSDREIVGKLGFTDGNAVKPRITNLVKRGVLGESRSITCPVTGRTVRTVYLKAAALGFWEPNSTRPRITSLIQKHVLAEGPNVKDATTGKTVRTTYVCARVQESLLV